MSSATNNLLVLTVATLLVAGGMGCGKRDASRSISTMDSSSVATAAASTSAAPIAEAQHGSRRVKNLDVPVLVDGVQVAVLRSGELPTQLVAHDDKKNEVFEARYYRFTEYFAEIGVDVSKIKAVHFQANTDRVASIEGDELRAQPTRFVFDFLGKTSGSVKAAWDTTGMKNQFHSTEMYAVSVFVNKPAPAVNVVKSCYMTSGHCSNALAYVDNKVPTGTRVYQDGKLVGTAKRKNLEDGWIMGRDGDVTRYSVAKLAQAFGADTTNAKSIDLLQGDDVVARFTAAEWQSAAPALSFKLPQHNHGKIRIFVPANVQAPSDAPANREATISAIVIHKSSPLSPSEPSPISDEAAPQATAVTEGAPQIISDEGT
jgi:hypothetical protein